jgi:hypothetical protein
MLPFTAIKVATRQFGKGRTYTATPAKLGDLRFPGGPSQIYQRGGASGTETEHQARPGTGLRSTHWESDRHFIGTGLVELFPGVPQRTKRFGRLNQRFLDLLGLGLDQTIGNKRIELP